MSHLDPTELAHTIGGGLLSFPVTSFDSSLEFDENLYRTHVDWLASFPVAGLFAAGGTGEFFSLSLAEVDRIVRLAVETIGGRVPVIAPAGGQLPDAIALARAAEAAGADGLLLFPPYLTEVSQSGLEAYVTAIAKSTSLGIMLYSRANAKYAPETLVRLTDSNANIIGFKDGVGDIDSITRIVTQLGDRLTYLGGLPTAETYARPYLELGVTTYSSAIFNFVPEFALGFYNSVRARDHAAVTQKLNDFVLPLIAIRDREQGYGVSMIKAGLRAVGRNAGPVRPPLSDLTPQEFEEIQALVAQIS